MGPVACFIAFERRDVARAIQTFLLGTSKEARWVTTSEPAAQHISDYCDDNLNIVVQVCLSSFPHSTSC